LRVGSKGINSRCQSAEYSGDNCRAERKKKSGGASSDDCFGRNGVRRDHGSHCFQSEMSE